MSSEVPSSQAPVSLQFGNSETTGNSQSFSGFVAGSVQFQSGQDRLDALPRAEGASFNSAELEHERLCLPGTRTKILDLIEQWTVNPQGERIFWLSGMAGTGKSAIARTLAHTLSEKKQLGASFFFSRGRGDRGDASKFFTSIAYQLALLDAENGALAQSIRKAINQHPDIFTRAKRDQWKFLIQEPLSQLKSYSTNGTVLVLVIDALDECENDEDVKLILRLLCQSPRISVRDGFLDTIYKSLILHEIERYIVQGDLRIFFGHELGSLQKQGRLTLGEDDIDTMVQRAGELFIYAATICSFVAQKRHPPHRKRLEIVLQNNAFTTSPQKNLDQLYIQILREAASMNDSAEEKALFCSHFRVIIGSVVSLISPLSVISLAALLFERLDSIELTLDNLLSILNVTDVAISLIHPSFRDFLLDKKRCNDNDFWVDSAETHLALAKNSLRLMAACLRRDICDLHLPGILIKEINPERVRECISPELEYACTYWVRHLESSVQAANGIPGHDVLDTTRHFFEQKTLYWLEALSLLGKMQESVLMLSTLLTIVESCDDNRLHRVAYDVYRFVLQYRATIEQAPLQTYYSALVFSPTESVLWRICRSQVPGWISRISRTTSKWGPLMQTLEGKETVISAKFSPDQLKLMSFSANDTVRIWDARTGMLLQRFQIQAPSWIDYPCWDIVFNGETIAFIYPVTIEVWNVTFESHIRTMWLDLIHALALSPIEQKLASGSSNGSVRVWDITSGMLLQTCKGYASDVISLEFSPNGQKLASKCRNRNMIFLWHLGSASLLYTLRSQFELYDPLLTSPLAFSRNGKTIACEFCVGTVEIWDAESGAVLQTLGSFGYNNKGVALNEHHLASWNFNGTVRMWDVPTGSLLRTFICDSPLEATVWAFSLIGQRLVSGSMDGNVNIWDAAFKSPLSQQRPGHDNELSMLVFSPNGQKLASLSANLVSRKIWLWDVAAGSVQDTRHTPSFITSVAFSADGVELLAWHENKVKCIWDLESGKFSDWQLQWQLQWRNIEIHDTTANPSCRLNLIDRWVTVSQKRLIRIPPGWQAATCGTKLAVGSSLGNVTFMDLDLELIESSINLPTNLAHGQDGSPSHVHVIDSASEDDDDSSDIEYLGQRECRRE